MPYYNYHAQLKKRILNKEFSHAEFVDKYKNISPCLILYFYTEPKIRPIRKHKFNEYMKLI